MVCNSSKQILHRKYFWKIFYKRSLGMFRTYSSPIFLHIISKQMQVSCLILSERPQKTQKTSQTGRSAWRQLPSPKTWSAIVHSTRQRGVNCETNICGQSRIRHLVTFRGHLGGLRSRLWVQTLKCKQLGAHGCTAALFSLFCQD